MPNPVAAALPNPASYDTSVAGVVTDRVTGLTSGKAWIVSFSSGATFTIPTGDTWRVRCVR
jgi:hypothetical protein